MPSCSNFVNFSFLDDRLLNSFFDIIKKNKLYSTALNHFFSCGFCCCMIIYAVPLPCTGVREQSYSVSAGGTKILHPEMPLFTPNHHLSFMCYSFSTSKIHFTQEFSSAQSSPEIFPPLILKRERKIKQSLLLILKDY